MKDSYEQFFELGHITKKQLFDFGLNETIYAPKQKAEQAWAELKATVENNGIAYIRNYGQRGRGTHLYLDFYAKALGNGAIGIDQTNNRYPAGLIRHLTGYARSKKPKSGETEIRNYQISHVFARTKNPYAFTAPWNIVYMPKMLDPFTGHEAKGEMIVEFTAMFQRQCFEKFQDLIEDFNSIMTAPEFLIAREQFLETAVADHGLNKRAFNNLKKSMEMELSPIKRPE
jgi:hypothetical protein